MYGLGNSLRDDARVRLYLDESGTDDPGTPHAILGGMLVNSSGLHSFEDAWEDTLERHRIKSPLHMKQFGRPNGKFARVSDSCRFELFSEIAELINSHKLYSVSATLTNADYRQYVSHEIRQKFSVYGMCFLLVAVLNHKMAASNRYSDRIPFILDAGNPRRTHIEEAHAEMLEMERRGDFLHTGSLHFEDDRDFGILQAADVIAWASRRKASQISFGPGLSPVSRVLEKISGHEDAGWQSDWMAEVSTNVMAQYREAQKNDLTSELND